MRSSTAKSATALPRRLACTRSRSRMAANSVSVFYQLPSNVLQQSAGSAASSACPVCGPRPRPRLFPLAPCVGAPAGVELKPYKKRWSPGVQPSAEANATTSPQSLGPMGGGGPTEGGGDGHRAADVQSVMVGPAFQPSISRPPRPALDCPDPAAASLGPPSMPHAFHLRAARSSSTNVCHAGPPSGPRR